MNKKDAAEQARIQAEIEAKRKEDERIAAEAAAKAEQERIEAERPDNQKLADLALRLATVPFPEVSGKKAAAKLLKARKAINDIVDELKAA